MNQMMKEDTSASLQTSVTRAGTIYQLSDVKKEDAQNVPLVYSIWGAARKLKENTAQLSTQAVANVAAAAEKAAADVAALERAAAEQTVAIVAVEQAVAIKANAEAVTAGDNLHEELERMQLMLIAERAAAAAARDEATAAIYILEAENKRLLLLLAAANSPVPVPVAAANSPVPANANLNGPTTRTQPATLAMSNSLTYAQAVTSSVPDVRRLVTTYQRPWRRPYRQRCKLFCDRGHRSSDHDEPHCPATQPRRQRRGRCHASRRRRRCRRRQMQ